METVTQHYICAGEKKGTKHRCPSRQYLTCAGNYTNTHRYLAEYIRIRVILQEHGGCARIVVACCNVQRGEAHLSLGAVVDEQGYDILVSLLERHGERSESILQHTGETESERSG